MTKPLVIGLTGSIGMGKSTTAQMFRDTGIPVWSADDAVHLLYGPNGLAVKAIAELCPAASTKNGIDRKILSDWIARTPGGLSSVEAVVHPLVAADRARFLAAVTSDMVVLDIPLLFETGGDAFVDAVVVVTAPAHEQRRRVLERTDMTEAKLKMILSKQLSDAEKRLRADYVVETTSPEAARSAVQNLIGDMKKRQSDA